MLKVRKANERGYASFDWLESYHTFSFANYYDREYIHFSHLRVINEDFIAPDRGFGMHPHDNMEILTYVLNGRVAHKDSMGHQTEVNAGEFQIMSAGAGIFHSEINPSLEDALHLYQIWIIPNQKDIVPRYDQGRFEEREGGVLILSPTAEQGSFKVYQDMKLWRYQYSVDQNAKIELDINRSYWLQVVKGQLSVNGIAMAASDALALRDEALLTIQIHHDAEFLLFDLV